MIEFSLLAVLVVKTAASLSNFGAFVCTFQSPVSPLRIVASYSDTRRFCGKNAVESNLETHFFGVQSTNLGLCQVEKYSLCPVYAMYEDTCQSDPERFGGNCWCGSLWMLLFMLAYRMRSDAESSPNCTVY